MGITVRAIGPTNAEIAKNTGEWVKRNLIRIAHEELRAEVDRGFDNKPVVVTDGMPRRAPDQVKPFGKIVFAARANMAAVVRWALTELQKKSPVLSGRYASSHVIMINKIEVKGDIWAALRAIKDTDRVQIVNPQPYARKIESATASKKTGRGARKALSRQAKGGVYRPVLRALVSRYNRSMFFDFTYVKLNTGVKVWGDQGGRYRKNGTRTRAKRVQRDQVYPSLNFFIKPGGLTN